MLHNAATRAWLFAVILCGATAVTRAQSTEHRLNDFFLETSEHARVCSFLVHEKTVEETGGDTPRIHFVERTFRKVIDRDKKLLRIDSQTEQPSLTPGQFLQEHFLDVGELQISATDLDRVGNIRSSVKSNMVAPSAVRCNFLHLPVNAQTLFAAGTRISNFSNVVPIFDRMQSDRRLQGYFAAKGLSDGCRITFSREPHWLVEEIEFLKGSEDIDEYSPSQGPPSRAQIEKWTSYGKTVTRWDKVGKWWVPVYISMSSRTASMENGMSRPLEGSSELFLTDWRFGDDVDRRLLDKDNFTAEKISASVDFDAWNEELRKQAKDLMKKRVRRR